MPVSPEEYTIEIADYKPDILLIQPSPYGDELIRIDPDGNIFWKGRLVESDDDFKASMLDLASALVQ